ncbi:cytochrome c oxidase assembly factor CtaG [Mycobacterium basiliense]|uniref:Cytochrome c oxidase assembly factor CtaG n=1 Tax=Mycobacterium basiliense TaxID=2094119 RepID=A0A3S4DQE3_9MYCO|nr:cytochrome c oxidase assembly protein [Mycobacterium basiliense]VDM86676.1 cytochrome c oxidase assembly factor CtaG [Mycobacterium basiliense]
METEGPVALASSTARASRSNSWALAWLLVGLLGGATALAAYGLLSGVRRYATVGNPYPGAFLAVAEPVGYFAACLAGAVCLGAMVCVVMMARPERDGLIDPASFRIHLVAERVSIAWAALAAAMVIIQAAHDSGVAPTRLLTGGGVVDAVAASEIARGWIVTVICALVVTVTLRLHTRWLGHLVLLVPTVVAVIATAVTGNPGQGPDHDYATSAAIVFAVAVTTLAGLKITMVLVAATPSRAVQVVQVACGALALSYGAMLLYLLIPRWEVDSDFARLGLLAGLLLLLVWMSDCRQLFRTPGRSGDASTGAALAAMTTVAALAAMAVQTAPRYVAHQFTAWDVFLGYELPQPPNAVRLVTTWRFDSLVGVAGIVLAIGYLAGFVVLRRRGNAWPAGRLASWLTGCAVLVVTSSSGVRAYGSAMFSVHMAEHMTLNMFIPVLLVLGGPVTLALRVLPAAGDGQRPGPREWLTWLLHSRVTAFFSHPITAFILFVASPYIVYFTPLFDTLVRYHWGHEFMAVHFLLVGYLFYWAIIGIDPGPRRLPYPGRIGLLFAVMPFHAFFGIALMTTTSAVGGVFYKSVDLPWLASIEADQHLGGGIAWGATELPIIIVIVALVAQWARQDRRVAARQDRHADSSYGDDDLEAYNAMLRELSRMRR